MFEARAQKKTTPPVTLPADRQTPDEPLNALTPPRAESPDLLTVETNVSRALQQREEIRAHDYRSGKNAAFHNNLIAGCLLGGAAASFTLVPPIPFEHPLAHIFAATSVVIGVASAVQASRLASAAAGRRHRSEIADKHDTNETFERAERVRMSPDSRAELVVAGRCYVTLLEDSHGAPLIAKSLIALTDCIEKLGVTSPESAALVRDIGETLSPNYTDLPVQRQLARIALTNAQTLNETLESASERHTFARSVARLVRIGLGETRDAALASATEIYEIARAIPQAEPILRAELLGAAAALSRATDPIRENIEGSLREIVNSLPRATPADLREYDIVHGILERYGVSA